MVEYIEREAATNVACNILWRMNSLSMNNLSTSVMAKALNSIPAADVAPVRHGIMRVEVTTDDFKYAEMAKEKGWHRKKFFCPICDQLIKTETWDNCRIFGVSTVLKTDETVNYCPNCGAKMDGGAE